MSTTVQAGNVTDHVVELDAQTINQALKEAQRHNDADASWMYSGEHNDVVYRDVSLLTPTVKINRDGPITELPTKHNKAIGSLEVAAQENATVEQLADQFHLNQVVVYSKGNIVFEKYRPGFDGNTQHLMQSIAKTMTAMALMPMVEDKLIDVNKQVTDYVPELKGTFYDGATVRNVLDMSVGLSSGDNYGAHDGLNAQVKAMQAATGYAEFAKDREDDVGLIEYMKQYNTHGKTMMNHGDTAWFYNSQNANLLALIMERVSNRKWADLFRDHVYSHVGANNDATIIYSLGGYGGFDGGFSVSPKDLIRIILAHTRGKLKDSYYNRDTFQSADRIRESRITDEVVTHPEIIMFVQMAKGLSISHYRNQTYLGTNPANGRRLYYGLGVYGQSVVWSPDSDFIMVTTGTYNPSSMKGNITALFAAHTIEASL